ncbi:MAG: B12-binding domain-containing radical SAM protein [Candidatus Bathyarchaeia archaeon]
MGGHEIVLTADRSLMSDYLCQPFLRGLRFASTSILHTPLFFRLVCPPVPAVEGGVASFAPYHTRRTEAALLDYGFERGQVVVVAPDKVNRFIGPETRVISITTKDPLSMIHHYSLLNPLHRESYSSMAFRELIKNPHLRRYGSKVVVEGPGAWQLADQKVLEKFSIDCVVVGEYPTTVIPPLFESMIRGETTPSVVYSDYVDADSVPMIRGGVTEGLVEVARGCNRRCRFCTVPRLRCRPIDDIIAEVKVNAEWGQHSITLRSDDILNYKANGVSVNHEAVISLYESVRKVDGVKRVGQCYFSLASAASEPALIAEISDIIGVGCREYPYTTGLTGIESGSSRMIGAHMPGKAKPFSPSDWADIVEQGFGVCNDSHWVPLGMLILGFPGEKEGDVTETLALVERLRPYKSVLIPFVFKAKGALDRTESFELKDMRRCHLELVRAVFQHNVHWGKRLIREQMATTPLLRWLIPFLTPFVSMGIERAYGRLWDEVVSASIDAPRVDALSSDSGRLPK